VNFISNIAREGPAFMEIQSKFDFTVQCIQAKLDTAIGLIPSEPVQIISQELSNRYETEKLGFEWRTQNKPQPEYLLGNMQFLVKEYPKRDIEIRDVSSSSSSNLENEKLFDTKG
jgi:hypothetical protein